MSFSFAHLCTNYFQFVGTTVHVSPQTHGSAQVVLKTKSSPVFNECLLTKAPVLKYLIGK